MPPDDAGGNLIQTSLLRVSNLRRQLKFCLIKPLILHVNYQRTLKKIGKKLTRLHNVVSIPVMGWSGGIAHMAGLCIFLILPSTSSTASLPFRACNSQEEF